MADVEVVRRPLAATYGRRRRDETPLSDAEGQSSQPSPPARDSLFLDSSPLNKEESHRSRYATNDEETGNTSASSSDERDRAAFKPRSSSIGLAPPQPSRIAGLENSDDDDDDDEETSQNALDRVRAQLGVSHPSSSNGSGSRRDAATSSLSSAPSLSQPQRPGAGNSKAIYDSDADEEDSFVHRTAASRPNRVGLLAGRMKARMTTSSSTDDQTRPCFGSQRSASPRRSFVLSDDDSSHSDSAPDSQLAQLRKDRLAATQRKQKLEEMAAKRRQAAEAEVSLEDDFFNNSHNDDAPATDDPIRSSSNVGEDSDEDYPDAHELIQRAAEQRRQHDGSVRGDSSVSSSKHRSSKSSKKATRPPKGPKPLSKKEQEEMHKMQAKIERSRPMPSLALQSHPVDRQEYSIAQLAAKFQQPESLPSADEDDPIESDTPRRPAPGTAVPAKGSMANAKPSTILTEGSCFSDPVAISSSHVSVEELQRRKAQEALKLRKQKWLQAQQENAQRPSSMADSIESTGSDLVFDMMSKPRAGAQAAEDEDDLTIIDSTAPSSSRRGLLFVSKLQERSRSNGASTKKAPADRSSKHAAQPAGMSAVDFKQAMLDKVRRQNISIRQAREMQAGGPARNAQHSQAAAQPNAAGDADESADVLKKMTARLQQQPDADEVADAADGHDGGSEDEDFWPEDSGSDDDHAGSGEEEDQIEDASAKVAQEYENNDGDSLAEDEADVMPPSSQNTNRSVGRTGMDSDEDEDDEVEMHTARPGKKRAQLAVVDEDDEEQHQQQQQQQHKDDSPPASAPLTGKSAGFGGGPGGLTQFFQDTQQSDHEELPESQRLAAQAASDASLHRTSAAPPSAGAPKPTNDSVLGQFFADTQLSQTPRGHSLDVIGATGRAKNADHFAFVPEGGSLGDAALSQFFNEGTQITRPTGQEEAGATGASLDAPGGSMPPPRTIPTDGFAALRRQAQGDGEDLLGSPDSILPSPDHSPGNFANFATPRAAPLEPARQYLNHEGFFTQTRPVASAPAPDSAGSRRRSLSVGSNRGGADSFASQWGATEPRATSADEDAEEHDVPSSPSARRKRFRRALQPLQGESEGEEEAGEEEEDEEEEEEADEGDSRGSGSDVDPDERHPAAEEDEEEDDDVGSAAEDDVHPGATANAWDVLKRAAQRADLAKSASKKKSRRRNEFIEGEAEESEDEEGTRQGGGLKGVFDKSDDEGNEDSDSDDDGADLEGLVDDVHERDEAAKDKLALARYQQDMDVDEAAALALAEKAAKGELRNKRRNRGLGAGLEGLLDDDFDEERLKRLASRPKGFVAKRRKLEGGDGMDLLASKAESRAFVEGYAETHDTGVGEGEYTFLAAAEDEGDESDDDEEEDEDEDRSEEEASPAKRDDDDLDELDRVFAQRITRKELAKELKERRKNQRRQRVASDDEYGDAPEEAQASVPPASRDFFASDESDDEVDRRVGAQAAAKRKAALPSFLHDRLNSSANSDKKARTSSVASRSRADAHHDDDDEEDDDPSTADPASALIEGLKRRRAVSPRTAERLARVAAEYGDRSDAASYVNAGQNGGGGSSITSFGARAARQVDRQKAGAGAFVGTRGSGEDARATAAAGGSGGDGRRRVAKSASGLLAKRVVEESQ
ncbi:hypothetical protein BDZ90DRAFT_228500 [Jaminaea rosea]|uniref:DNA replication checkpoint mediator MRC1 domain-containing protein n=1 Tax=Jaminaea rosea TaxID=1569628 RepID=A0A316UIM1_9BASI|nr:hypothetical protein BDZ90DRAFT_228500 [Jaminaea rosea]PWN25122.1 hypothetical protein BDZ90DRAFT_228500 [Jaminaea rosea]